MTILSDLFFLLIYIIVFHITAPNNLCHFSLCAFYHPLSTDSSSAVYFGLPIFFLANKTIKYLPAIESFSLTVLLFLLLIPLFFICCVLDVLISFLY